MSHPTDCNNVKFGKECADRHVKFSSLCPGCKVYWTEAAKLAGKTPQAWYDEVQADIKRIWPHAKVETSR